MVKKNYVKGEFIFENNLKTNGTMGIGAYTFPNTDGSNGQVLLTDGSGTVTWSDVSGGGCSFGDDNQIPYTNATTNDFDYSANYTFDGSKLALAGYFDIGDTTTSTTGVIYKGATPFLHNFHHPTGGTAVPSGYNVFLGEEAGNFTMGSTATSTTHGSFNIGIGREALGKITTGVGNIAAGYQSGGKITTGTSNFALGHTSLAQCTTGSGNVAVGAAALNAIVTGSGNIALGTSSLRVCTGSSNTGLGGNSLRYTTSGSHNASIGASSMSRNSTGGYNIGIGSYSLAGNNTGSQNVALGYMTMFGTNGSSNIFRNVAIGHNAGYNILTGANNNVMIGYYSGRSITTGANNIYLGAYAGYRQTTASNLLIIDNQGRTDAATEATNAILYGVMASTPASQTLSLNAVTTFAQGVKSSDGSAGITTTFTNGDGDTVTVKDGLITSVA